MIPDENKIDQMKAGDEMDLLIATYVYDYQPLKEIEKNAILKWERRRSYSDPVLDRAYWYGEDLRFLPSFSTETQAAFELADKFRISLNAQSNGTWRAIDGDNHSAEDASLPLAICRCVLKGIFSW